MCSNQHIGYSKLSGPAPPLNVLVQIMTCNFSRLPTRSAMTNLRIGNRTFKLPQSRSWRIVVGVALIIGGILGFLPIVGFWMIPLGTLVLSNEFHVIRRLRRRMTVKWGRRKQRHEAARKFDDEYLD